MIREQLRGVTPESLQTRRLKLPRGDVLLPDGRVLRRIIGYDLSKVASNENTQNNFLESAGWRHVPSRFIVSAGSEDTGRWGALLHVSMSYPDRDPSWDEIKAVRAIFFPADVDTMMMLPKEADYINAHSHCFHVWQCPEIWGLL